MDDVAVDIQSVSKRFRLYQEKYTSLKERVIRAGRTPYRDLWALEDVNFEVYEGETIGILGQNGSGKSTLLKCVCGVLQPTSGQIVVRGKLSGLLELGAGFQQDLSGRDNIYLNGSMLGMSRREIDKVFDDIVSFSELDTFIDNQVKFYSSGMYVRLGFAVAVNVDPDVLVVDEVLAVGDERFQRKCLGRIKQFQDEGRTIFFVTHGPDLVRQICDRGVLLHEGHVLATGTSSDVIAAYHQHLVIADAEAAAEAASHGSNAPVITADPPISITAMEVEHAGSGERSYLYPHEPMTVWFTYEATRPVDNVVFSYAVFDAGGGLVHASDTALMDEHLSVQVGTGRVQFHFPEIPLLEGTYNVHIAISGHGGIVYDVRESGIDFTVMNTGRGRGRVALEPQVEISTASLT